MVPVLLLCGCLSEAGFVERYAEAECALLWGCYDQEQRDYLGWETVDDCIALGAHDLGNRTETCFFDSRAGNACLGAMAEVTACPRDLAALEPPAVCAEAFHHCRALSEEQFADLSAAAVCRWHYCDSGRLETFDACVEDMVFYTPNSFSDCGFMSQGAAECLDDLEALTCEDEADYRPPSCSYLIDCD